MKLLQLILLLIALLLKLVQLAPAEVAEMPVRNVDGYLQNAVQHDYSGSVLVAQQGKVLLSQGYGMADRERHIPYRSGTVFDIGSLTKQFTAAAILKLEMQEKLSVRDPISKYLDGVPEDRKGITIHQLLTHTAGFTDSLGEDEEWIGKEDFLKLAFQSEPLTSGRYSYSNVGYSILAAIVEKASGQEYEHFLREQLFLPAGMKTTGYVLPQWKKEDMAVGYSNNEAWGTTYEKSAFEKGVTWHLKGNGGIHSTVEDLYRWYQALQGNTVLSAEARGKYFAPQVVVAGNVHYAYGWSVRLNRRGETVITHNGGNGYFMATILMVPARNFVAIVSTNNNPKNTDVIAARIDRMLFENLQPLDPKFVALYAGEYALPGGGTFSIGFDENDTALAAMNDSQSFRVLSGAKEDDPQTAAGLDRKLDAMWKALQSGDFAAAASAAPSDVPEKEAQQFLAGMRDRIRQRSGEIQAVEVLGSVSRRAGSIYISVAKIRCEKETLYQLYIWQEGHILDVRPPERANSKSFEHESGADFYAEANDKRISFGEEDGKPVARIGEIVAYRKELPATK